MKKEAEVEIEERRGEIDDDEWQWGGGRPGEGVRVELKEGEECESKA